MNHTYHHENLSGHKKTIKCITRLE